MIIIINNNNKNNNYNSNNNFIHKCNNNKQGLRFPKLKNTKISPKS